MPVVSLIHRHIFVFALLLRHTMYNPALHYYCYDTSKPPPASPRARARAPRP